MNPDRWRRIELIYHAALEREQGERTSYLQQACAEDSELLRQVESLLAQGNACSFLDKPPELSEIAEPPAGFDSLIGRTIGGYEILSLLGAGGMGEVYKARDTQLNRPVAIKFLALKVAGAEARKRFQREAQMASSLNHPHILAVYAVGEFEGRQYLVTEYVDGGTLKDWSAASPRPWHDVVDLLTGVSDGLAAAHQAGVLHRDIKSANILVAKNGYAKLADFGLAKLREPAGSGQVASAEYTRPGAVMGTIPYMSPEQAAGKPVDPRSDVFSFGIVMYEALCGRRPFDGATDLDLLHNIVHVPANPLPQSLPQELRRVVEKSLAKNPDERYQSMRELTADLRRLMGRPSVGLEPPAVARPNHRLWLLPALTLLIAGVAGIAWFSRRPTQPLPNPLSGAQFTQLTDFEGAETNPAISPDGKFVAFLSDRSGTFDIWLSQDNGSLSNLTQGRIGDARAPLRAIGFSGDGSEVWSGGVETRRLTLWSLVGGASRNFLDDRAAEVAWSPDGKNVVYHTSDPGDPTFVADHNGANPRQIVKNDAGLHNHYQIWSKDGRSIYLVRGRPATREMDLWRISSAGGKLEQLTHLNTDISYPTPLDDRRVLYIAHNESGAGPWLWMFDTYARTSQRLSLGLEQYTAVVAAANGRRLAAGVVNSQVNLWSVPIGPQIAAEREVSPYSLPTVRALTPRFGKGTLFYLSSRDGADGLWNYRDGQALEIWKGSDGALRLPPAVSADGSNIAIALLRNGRWQMHVIAADGTRLRALSADVDVRGSASWSPDGRWLAVAGSDRDGAGLFKLPAEGGAPARIATGAFLDPVWSPRGDLIVYEGTQVFTSMPLQGIRPDGTPVKLPEINVRREGERARFLPDGSGLVYMLGSTTAEQDFWLLDLASMRSRRLTRLNSSATMRTFDISPDGRQLVFDRARENSKIMLIDLAVAAPQARP